MAVKSFATGNALSNKLWSAKIAKEVEKKTYFGRFMGEGEDNIIQVKTETGRAAGDKITCGLVMSLTQAGVTEGQALEGNEEDLTTYDDSLFINELNGATRFKSKMTIDAQRVPYNLRDIAKNRLSQWFATRMDTAMFLHLCGYTGDAFSRDGQSIDPDLGQYNGNNAVTAPTSGRHIWAGGNSDDQSINSATDDRFILELIDEAVLKAKTAEPYISPINVGGQDKYVMFLHPSQVKDLRTDASTSRITWYQTQSSRIQGGELDKNPIFTGALGEYNGVVLHESFRIPNGVNSSTGARVANTKRAVLCGKQAGMVAYGRQFASDTKYDWSEETFDYGRQMGIGVHTVWGIKKSVFNSKDYATVVVSSYGAD